MDFFFWFFFFCRVLLDSISKPHKYGRSEAVNCVCDRVLSFRLLRLLGCWCWLVDRHSQIDASQSKLVLKSIVNEMEENQNQIEMEHKIAEKTLEPTEMWNSVARPVGGIILNFGNIFDFIILFNLTS